MAMLALPGSTALGCRFGDELSRRPSKRWSWRSHRENSLEHLQLIFAMH